jgi:hypothetical protein
MGSGVMIYIPSFIKIGSRIHKLLGGGIHRQQRDLMSLLLFFQNKESRLKEVVTSHKHYVNNNGSNKDNIFIHVIRYRTEPLLPIFETFPQIMQEE